MYNRYIPQADGTFLRSRMQEPAPNPEEEYISPAEPPAPQQPVSIPAQHKQATPDQPRQMNARHQSRGQKRNPSPDSVGNFLKQLLPQNMDTEDLIVVLLLLLMSGNGDQQNNALLTLVIYLFL